MTRHHGSDAPRTGTPDTDSPNTRSDDGTPSRSRSPLPGRSHADDSRATRERLAAARPSNTSSSPQPSATPSTAAPGGRPGATGPTPPHHTAPWPDPMDLRVVDISPMNANAHLNEAHVVTFEDGSQGLYKPVTGEDTTTVTGVPPSGLAPREAGASVVDRHLGLGLTPATTMWDGPQGHGSLQRMAVPNTGSMDPGDYTSSEQQRMAVLDYVIGNSDRHNGNYLTDQNGGVVPIDHGYSFPVDQDSFDRGPIRGIRSDFVANEYGNYLDQDIIDGLNRVDADQLGDDLSRLGLEDRAVDGAISRLDEIRQNGGITGANWPGRITEAHPLYVARETRP